MTRRFGSLGEFHDLERRGLANGAAVRLLVSTESETLPESRVVSFVFSDNSVDSYGDTIAASGWDLTAYKTNPVVLFAHDPNAVANVIGRAFNVRVSGNKLLGDIEFATAAANPDAEKAFRLLKDGFLNAVSVGFLPIEWKAANDRNRPGGVDFTKQKLIEVSVVPIPANSNALVTARNGARSIMETRMAGRNSNAASIARARRQEAERDLYAFRSLGEQLQAIVRSEVSGQRDERLVRAPSGANEGSPSAGGFLVQVNFADDVLSLAYEDAQIAPLCTRPQLSGSPIASVQMPGIDETSRADGSRYGGITSYWAAEADQITGSFPRFKSLEFAGKKLIGVCNVTNELLADAGLLDFYIRRAFAAEFGFKLDAAVLNGSAGTPLGILNSNALITVPKAVGQAAATITAENVTSMWKRLPAPSRRRSSWLVHEDVESLLPAISGDLPPGVYQPAGVGGSTMPRLMGAPIVAIEQASVVGTPGDIVLADLSHYIILDGGMTPALSVHFKFDSDQATFRFVLRVDGKSEFSSPITPYSGSTTRSPFVALAAR